ncbi:PadR family transcriptional regulator [Cuneatibacter caecimuris]|uniref:PadR family transcriptional regulator PadR n=1 Tax=Cuneatibacter caecimuris TaxID=1796618 RepID=A0A4Q7P290_9FIRM|nr:PadR family transcriptional regulator [Cuneatibacter caecimuris]RZS92772.1 PadR family transcriptional regulator PadR [Cuneatibacter caecimuris]
MNAQLKKGALELCVLAQLAPKDRYGYELTDTISQEMSIAAGTLYVILKRFKEEAYVETYLVESPDGPARKYYHLTPSGHEYLKKSLREWKEFVLAVERLTEN